MSASTLPPELLDLTSVDVRTDGSDRVTHFRHAVEARLVELVNEHIDRANQHRSRLTRTAYRLGLEVASGRATTEDARRRLRNLEEALDPDITETSVPLVAWHEAERIVADGFEAGVRAARDRRAS